MLTAAIRDEVSSELVGVLVAKPKEFRTGSRGYFGSGKIVIDGKRYQGQVQLVEIGTRSEPDGENDPD